MNSLMRFKRDDKTLYPNRILTKLREVAEVKGGVGFPAKYQNEDTVEIPFFKVSDMNSEGNERVLSSSNNYISYDTLLKKLRYKAFNTPAIVFAKVGAALLLDRKRLCYKKFLIDNNMMAVIVDSKKINAEYMYYYLLTVNLASLSQVGALPSINSKQVNDLNVFLPCLEEQQKIAAFFSELDRSIVICERKLFLLERVREWATNYLLVSTFKPNDSKLLRSNVFKKVTVNEISEFVTVGIANAARHAYCGSEDGVPMLRNMNIKPNKLDDSDIVYVARDFANGYKNKALRENDIIVCRTGEPGTACLVPKKFEGAQTFTTLIIRLKEGFCPEYVCRYMNSLEAKKYIASTTIGGGQKNSGAGIIGGMPIVIPDIQTQKKISYILQCFDEKVNVSLKRLENLKRLKRSFMQQMFVRKNS